MRIAIVGTSNSVSKTGWLSTFRSLAKGHEVVNLSLGACPMIQAAQTIIGKKVAEDFDLCILEMPVNDQRYMQARFLDEATFAAWTAEAFAAFTPASRCKPLVLLLPHRSALGQPKRYYRATAVARQLLNARGIAFVDIERDLERARDIFGLDTEKVFMDWGHMIPEAQRIAGFAVHRALPFALAANSLILASAGLTVHPISQLTDLPRKRRMNSLLDVQTVMLSGSLKVQLSGYLCGIQHWSDAATGVLTIESNGRSRYKNLNKIWQDVLFLTDFQPAMPVESFVMSPGGAVADCEPSISASPHSPGATVEIAAIIMAKHEPKTIGEAILASVDRQAARSTWIDDVSVYRSFAALSKLLKS